MIKLLLSRRWILTTFLVLIAAAVMIRLGIWQLNRLSQRRAFNSHVTYQKSQEILMLSDENIYVELGDMEYRPINVSGVYEYSQEIIIRNQVWEGQAGVHLLTPLMIGGSETAIFVDRGWIPLEDYQEELWGNYSELGIVHVSGQIRLSQATPTFGGRPDIIPPEGESMQAWNFVNLEAISKQLPYPVLSVYVQQSPSEEWTLLPYRYQPELDLTEGPHLGYAGQWFLFTAVLIIGYPFFVLKDKKQIAVQQ